MIFFSSTSNIQGHSILQESLVEILLRISIRLSQRSYLVPTSKRTGKKKENNLVTVKHGEFVPYLLTGASLKGQVRGDVLNTFALFHQGSDQDSRSNTSAEIR